MHPLYLLLSSICRPIPEWSLCIPIDALSKRCNTKMYHYCTARMQILPWTCSFKHQVALGELLVGKLLFRNGHHGTHCHPSSEWRTLENTRRAMRLMSTFVLDVNLVKTTWRLVHLMCCRDASLEVDTILGAQWYLRWLNLLEDLLHEAHVRGKSRVVTKWQREADARCVHYEWLYKSVLPSVTV